jgi:RHH-type proline utilization regulon transcriptional repressor/proline dehydrogenase/delta 1-pyrroline-5-carboxylate dehydrogenase
VSTFTNEPVLELRRAENRTALTDALARLDATLPIQVPVLVGDGRGTTTGIRSIDPTQPDRVVAEAGIATAADAAQAVAEAQRAQRQWARQTPEHRARMIRAGVQILRNERHTLTALQVRECAKPWVEADADVCEAIDHIEYAVVQALTLAKGKELLQLPGERNSLRYRPRGVVAAIGPWNFPLAIPAGLIATGLATGNAVILKPAEQAPGSGFRLVDALRRGGVPPGVIQLLPGEGETGAALVAHRGVHTIAFTGSEPVGLAIVKAAAETPPEQHHVKRVVAEMGGKNAIIVDSDADLDQVVPDALKSAFAFAGQKCSAASRLLVHEAIAETLLTRLHGAVASLRVGAAEDFAVDVPPVIDQESQTRVLAAIAAGARDGRIGAQQAEIPDVGWYCPPTIVADLPTASSVVQEEIFGPVLTLEAVRSVDHALDLVEESRYALTGGIHSRNPRTVDAVVARSPVGNLYINRSITGAIVARQPFGGNRRSGIGAKVGGPDYVLQFVEPQVVTENTMRHGLVVE